VCFITPTNGLDSRTFDSTVKGRMGPRSGLEIQREENPVVPIRVRTPARPRHSLDTNRYLLSLFCSNAWRLVYFHRLASSCLISECFILLDCVYPSTILTLLGAFEKLRKAVTSFVVSVCLPSWNDSAPVVGLARNLVFEDFSKICREN